MYDLILFTDTPNTKTYSRGFGAHMLASQMRRNGYSVLVIDFSMTIDFERFKEILDLAIGPNTLAVGFSTTWFPYKMPNSKNNSRTTPWIVKYAETTGLDPQKHDWYFRSLVNVFSQPEIEDWFKYIKKINSKTKIFVGGTKVWMYRDLPVVDNFFMGYGETMVKDYLDSLSGKGPKRLFNTFVDYDSKAHAPTWDFRESSVSYPDESFILPSETLCIEVGRGCRFKCIFCSFPLIGQKNVSDYLKLEEILYSELLENWERWGVYKYYIVDDTFNDSTEKLKMMKRVVDRLPFKPAFWAYVRADLLPAHPEQIQLLKDIGIKEVYFGIETLNKVVGPIIKKGMDPEKVKSTMERCKREWGDEIWIGAALICGLPKDTVDEFNKAASYFDNPNRPADYVSIKALGLASKGPWTKFRFASSLEENYEDYGYSFPDIENEPWAWIKEDGTDITTWKQATELANYWSKRVDQHNKAQKVNFNTSAFLREDCRFENLKNLSDSDYFNVLNSFDHVQELYDQAEKYYFTPLLKFLKSQRTPVKVNNHLGSNPTLEPACQALKSFH